MQFIKRHWFGLIVSLIVLSYILLFLIILASPKVDIKKRGFIPCTEAFIEQANTCGGSWCMLKMVTANSFCDFKVVGNGFINWVKGEQPRPWSNYLFEPEMDDMDEGLQEFYEENPNLIYDLDKLKKLNKELTSRLNKDYGIEGPLEESFDETIKEEVEQDHLDKEVLDNSNIDEEVNEELESEEE